MQIRQKKIEGGPGAWIQDAYFYFIFIVYVIFGSVQDGDKPSMSFERIEIPPPNMTKQILMTFTNQESGNIMKSTIAMIGTYKSNFINWFKIKNINFNLIHWNFNTVKY